MIKILAVDDDSTSRKMIGRALAEEDFEQLYAVDGEDGLAKAAEYAPDIIVLDVEMPGMNGYDVCEKIRSSNELADISIVFLSSHSSLHERIRGYEAGGDDYLIKPFEKDDLVSKLKVLARYREEKRRLKEQFEQAHNTAMVALTGSSELGLAMQFVERSYGFVEMEPLIDALLDICHQFQLNCVTMLLTDDAPVWKSNNEAIKPLEKEMMEMLDRNQRFIDFGGRTIVNFVNLSLLIRNMPLDDMDRYGRIKDLLPMLLAAIDSKMNVIKVEQGLADQSKDLMKAFGQIRSQLYHLAKTLVVKQKDGEVLLDTMVTELNTDLLRMGLEEDQEARVLSTVENAIGEAIKKLDASTTMHGVFTDILGNLKQITQKQEQLQDAFASMNEVNMVEPEEDDGGIELF
ncbi:MAG: response regulator [Gammaproteobacteria bacterium]|nr:response regulator [Gammaproteobacteria bacterium]